MENKKSKKKLIFLIVTVTVILGMLGGTLYYIFKPEPPVDVTVINPERKDVAECFETTATVSSESQGVFSLIEGVTVTDLKVKVGDTVKKGDVLAKFDASSLNAALNQKKQELNKANSAYNEYMTNSKNASAQLSSLDKQISAAQNKVNQLEKEVSETKTNQQTQTQKSKEAEQQLADLTKDKSLAEKIVSFFRDDDSTLNRLISALEKLDNLSEIDLSSLMGSNLTDSPQTRLAQAQLELAGLKIRKTMLEAESKGTLSSVYKAVADYAYKSYNTVESQINSLKNGWIAEHDGIVSEVNIKSGETYTAEKSSGLDFSTLIDSITSGTTDVSSILSGFNSKTKSAISVEYYPLEASFIIGQSDLGNISVGQEAVVTTASGNNLKGKVSFISAVAKKSSGLDISSLLDGGSTASTTGVEAKVQIDKPTKDVIIGLDVNISIEVNRSKNAITVPVESIQYDSDKPFVFIVKKEKKKFFIYKQNVEVGLFDGSDYEILSGLTTDDEIVKSPTSTMQEGTRISPAIECS